MSQLPIPSFPEDDCTEALTSKVPHLEPGPLKRYFRLKRGHRAGALTHKDWCVCKKWKRHQGFTRTKERQCKGSHLHAKGRGLQRKQTNWHLDLRFLATRTGRISTWVQSLSLWYFIMPAQADEYTACEF